MIHQTPRMSIAFLSLGFGDIFETRRQEYTQTQYSAGPDRILLDNNNLTVLQALERDCAISTFVYWCDDIEAQIK